MSLRYEQYRSLKYTKEFMYDLLDPKKRPRSVKELRERVFRCTRHYPALRDDGAPIFSLDDMKEP
jgi:hypothetical protein